MRIITIIIFALTSRLVALATAKPVRKREPDGIAIPLARKIPNNETIDLDSITSHGILVREKILGGLDKYEVNTGSMHPFAVKQSESELGTRTYDAGVPLKTYENNGWIGQISIGTPPQIIQVQIDTGSADAWVVESGFPGHSTLGLDRWDPSLSKSAKKLYDKPFELANSERSMLIGGFRCIDRVTLGVYIASRQTFGSATWQFSMFPEMAQYPAGGVVGLAFPSISRLDASSLFQNLKSSSNHGRFRPVFSLKLSSSGAEMWVGGTNRWLYDGVITYTPVTNPGFWQVSMDDVLIDLPQISNYKVLENVPVIFDTGAKYIFGDWERVSKLYDRLGGTLLEHGDFGFYYLPCNSFPTLGFTFGGRTFKIPSYALRLDPIQDGSSYCFSGIIAQRSRIGFWMIGDTFLQGVYSVFDFALERVGFANLRVA